MRAWVVLLLLAPALAGCAGVPGLGGGDLTAKEAASRALERARGWRSDAALQGLATPEAPPGSAFSANNSDDFDYPFEADSSVGDGRARGWFLQYRSPSTNATLSLAVYANGTILTREDTDDDEDDDASAVNEASWQIDSPRAAEIALQDGNFSAAARASDGGIVYALLPQGIPSFERPPSMGAGMQASPPSADPHWMLISGSESARTGAMVLVNARTGERSSPGFPFGGGFPFGPGSGGSPFGGGGPRETYDFQGSVTTSEPEAEHPFEVGFRHQEIAVELSWQGTAPTDEALLQVRDPSGMAMEPAEEDRGDGSYTARYEILPGLGGAYTAVVRLSAAAGPLPGGPSLGVQADYELAIEVT